MGPQTCFMPQNLCNAANTLIYMRRNVRQRLTPDADATPRRRLPVLKHSETGAGTTMAKTVCKILGVVFLLVGIAGFANQGLLGAHLTPPHNVVHIVSGVIALYLGFAGSLSGAKGFCLVFGLVYLALGFLGLFVLGDPAADRMWHVGPLMLAKVDHFIHILLGIIFLAGGLLTKR
jgi:hypothetical protein